MEQNKQLLKRQGIYRKKKLIRHNKCAQSEAQCHLQLISLCISVRRRMKFDILRSNWKTITMAAVSSPSEKLSAPHVDTNQKRVGVLLYQHSKTVLECKALHDSTPSNSSHRCQRFPE